MTKEQKMWIDTATYQQLLQRWRHSPLGEDSIFTGATGDYYRKVMMKRKSQLTKAEQVAISKAVGWE